MRKLTFLLLMFSFGTFVLPTALNGQEQETGTVTIELVQVKLIRDVRLPAQEPGVLENLKVREGDFVKAGQVVAELDKKLYVLNEQNSKTERDIALERSRNDVNARFARKSMEVSKKVVERSQKAVERFAGSISPTEIAKLVLESQRDELSLEQAETELGIARMEVELREGQLDVSKLKLSFRSIVAPWDGVIEETFTQQGEWVNAGEPVLRIIDLNTLRIEAFVDGTRFDKSLKGKQVSFTARMADGSTETFNGSIDFVSSEIEPINNQIKIRAEIENPDQKLRPGQKGTLKIFPQTASS